MKRRFSTFEQSGLRRLIPIANRALEFAHSVHLIKAQGVAALGRPALALNHHGKVCFVSPQAEALFDQDFGVTGGVLWARDDHSKTQLAQLALSAREFSLSRIAPDCLICRRDGRRPILAQPIAVRSFGLEALPGMRHVVSLTDLNANPLPQRAKLRMVFGLTERESDIAAHLAAGFPLTEIAEALSLKGSTVREHLKSILSKTDCRRQAELSALFSRIAR